MPGPDRGFFHRSESISRVFLARRRGGQRSDARPDFSGLFLSFGERQAFAHAWAFVAHGREPGIFQQPLPLLNEAKHLRAMRRVETMASASSIPAISAGAPR